MTWENKLLETYDICQSEVGKLKDEVMLLPLSHWAIKAQIEVRISMSAEFITAFEILNEDATTAIPVTEDSASRGSGIAPHPLHDKLIYVAKDYIEYVDKDNTSYFEAHQNLLKQWINSPYTHPTLTPIYEYLEKGTLVHDLVNQGILKLNGETLDNKVKIQKTIKQNEVFIRFRIWDEHETLVEPWYDESLFETYHKFYMSLLTEKDLCYVTGKMMYRARKHPAKLSIDKAKAKIISTNDEKGFTYKGRLSTKEDAISVGYETSQKIHITLRWLIQKQAYKYDGQIIITWNAHCDKLLFPWDDEANLLPSLPYSVSTEETYANRVNRMIAGYKQNISDENEDIVIMALDAATEGRLSITHYQEVKVSKYYENLQNWFTICSWFQYSNSKYMGCVGTPVPKDIISCTYGTLHEKKFEVNNHLMTMQMGRILPCILENKPVPHDFVIRLNNQVKKMSKNTKYQWYRSMGILCAVFKKYCYDRKKEDWSVDILENKKRGNTNIAYILGRLLAIYDGLEQYALNEQNLDRATNAMRLYASFQEYPYRTLPILDKKIKPYSIRLGNKGKYLISMKENLMEELYAAFELENKQFEHIYNLDAYFVIGFDCQRNEIKRENQARKEKNEHKEEVTL